MTIPMYIASFAWLALVVGYVSRRKRAVHIRCMLTGIVSDISLVLYLQVTKDAVQKASEFNLPLLEQIHIGFSTVALLLYFPVLFLGISMAIGRSGPNTITWHKRFAIPALVLRTFGFIFMFSMLK